MNKILNITIPGIPVPNNTKISKYRFYKPKKVNDYKKYIQLEVQQYMRKHALKCSQEPIYMILWIGLPVPTSWSKKRREMALKGEIKHKTKPDGENFAILIKNALQNIVYKNDSQICVYYEKKFYVEHPYVKITIKEVK